MHFSNAQISPRSLHGSDLHLRRRLDHLHKAWRIAVEALPELAAVGTAKGLTVRKILSDVKSSDR